MMKDHVLNNKFEIVSNVKQQKDEPMKRNNDAVKKKDAVKKNNGDVIEMQQSL